MTGVSQPLQDVEVKCCLAGKSVNELGIDLTEAAAKGTAKKQLKQEFLQYACVFSHSNVELQRNDKVQGPLTERASTNINKYFKET